MTESTATTEIIRLDRVTKRFGGIIAVNEVSFGIAPGEIHAVVGENGAGKSTIMKMLAGVYQPDSGSLILRGEPVVIGDPLAGEKARRQHRLPGAESLSPPVGGGNIFANRETTRRTGAARRAADGGGDEARAGRDGRRSRSADESRPPLGRGESSSSRSRGHWSSSPRSSSWTSRTPPSAPPRRSGSSRCCAGCGTRV